MMGGSEHGNECYCGNDGDYQAAGSSFAPDTNCKTMPCPGNASEYWGAGIASLIIDGPPRLHCMCGTTLKEPMQEHTNS